ncbi:MAG: cytochrome c peroxidase [Deinococcales bacterium]
MKWLGRILALLIGLILLAVVILAFRQVPQDDRLAVGDYGAGSSARQPSLSGLSRDFPPLNALKDHEASPQSIELGRLLFFDPILSANNDMSCASCHHPDLGFGDGLKTAQGAGASGTGLERSGGTSLNRNSPSLWNVGYARKLFWDGRASSLEEQVDTPLMHLDEMAVADKDTLVEELKAIPAYQDLFQNAFNSEISYQNLTLALADFQRSLQSHDSPFDRYAGGDKEALSPSQRRGLNLFRSAATRCFECHQNPTFASDSLRRIGAGDSQDDLGDGNGRFKVPSLRNIALSAPYMHDGSLQSLEEVVDFYAEGGGRAHGVSDIDPFVLGFDLSDQERRDMVAFLYALTDESQLPEIPSQLPSGLSLVPHVPNLARDIAQSHNLGSTLQSSAPREADTLRVAAGESIQATVDKAIPGDTIEIPYGIYHERVVIDSNDITLVGLPNAAGEYPCFGWSRATLGSGDQLWQ